MSTVSKIAREIETASFIIKQRQGKLDELSRKSELSEREKIFLGEETQLVKSVRSLVNWYKGDINRSLGKLPPQATDIEESVLGVILLFKSEIGIEKVVDFLLEEHFYKEEHKIIYNACKFLHLNGVKLDVKVVIAQLRKIGKIEIVGGVHYLAELTAKVVSAFNIEYQSRILIEMAIKRRLILMAGKLVQEAYDDTRDCFELFAEAEEEMKIINSWIKK